jgi:putative oxidoreductase
MPYASLTTLRSACGERRCLHRRVSAVSTAAVVALLVRCGLVLLFLPFSALDKVVNFEGAVNQAREVFRPRLLGIAVILFGLVIEIFMSLAVVTGIADRAAALVLAGYCAITAVLYKRFWAQGDFWSDPAGKGRGLFWDFLKNLSLGAGLLLITFGSNGEGFAAFVAHPLASTQPYAGAHQ